MLVDYRDDALTDAKLYSGALQPLVDIGTSGPRQSLGGAGAGTGGALSEIERMCPPCATACKKS